MDEGQEKRWKSPVEEMTLHSRGRKGDIHHVPDMMLSSKDKHNIALNPSSDFYDRHEDYYFHSIETERFCHFPR